LIEILAETFNIYKPDANTLRSEAYQDKEGLLRYLMQNKELTGGRV